MKIEKIFEIEEMLNELANSEKEDFEDIVNKFLRSICLSLNFSLSSNFITSLFNERNSLKQNKFIAACILRALCRRQEILWGTQQISFRNKAFQLFDETLTDIYKKLGISINQTNDEKASKLQDLEGELIEKFSMLSKSLNTLEDCRQIKSKFMQLLFAVPANFFILSQFLDLNLIDKQRINSIFQLLEEYIEALSLDLAIELHKQIKEKYQAFIREIAKEPSKLAEICLGEIFKKIFNIIEKDFQSKDEIVPTQVKAKVIEKKYPFHLEKKEILIKVFINNEGMGKAFNVEIYIEEYNKELLEIINPIIKIGHLAPGEQGIFAFESITIRALETETSEIILGEVSWSNYSGERNRQDFIGELFSQSPHINWQDLNRKKPYVLEAVAREKELVGRSELFKQLYAKFISEQIESSIIFGQKRVGKTSIAKTIQNKLKVQENYTVIYLSVGSLDKNSSEKFLSSLGEFIFDEIYYDPSFVNFKLPELKFEGSITPLDRLFRIIRRQKPEHKFVIIIDEFDEIPPELYQYNSIGDNFFHNIRSLSSENNVGFLLVGGENMKIIKQSTDKLNKFQPFSVDYFDKEKFWNDFQELVRRPVKGDIEFTDDAIVELYRVTEGNPFFTKLICGIIYSNACETRNAYISYDEVGKATNDCLNSLGTNNINHFWKDGILKSDPAERDQIETWRRKFLISYTDIARSNNNITKNSLLDNNLLDSTLTSKILENFASRKIFVENDGLYRCKPRFFNDWLIGPGFQIMTSESLDEEAIEIFHKRQSQAFVSDSEIIDLCESWGLYKGAKISPQHIRAWLDQFENNIEKRLIFIILQNIKFYNELLVREKLRAIHEHVKKGLIQEIKQVNSQYERTNKNILLSAFGKPTNSGSSYLRMYASENKISRSSSNNVELDKVLNALEKNERLNTIVFIEDIIGSGGTVIEGLRQLNHSCGTLLAKREIKVVTSAICGFNDGIDVIESEVKNMPFHVEVFVCDILTEQDKCFSPESKIFTSADNRQQACQIAYDFGYKLVPKMPLGYKENQLLITFHETCPNNSLPILWAEQSNWKALFRRS